MGKPTAGKPAVSLAEYIGQWKPTGGTETSKYPQERKVTTTPLVAASERGISLNRMRVKTVIVAYTGLWGIV